MEEEIQLTQKQKAGLKRIMRDEAWDIIALIYEEQMKIWGIENVGGNTDFEVIRSVFKREGKMEGLKYFFDRLDLRANE